MRVEGPFKQKRIQGWLVRPWKSSIRILQEGNVFPGKCFKQVRASARKTFIACNLSLKSLSEFLNRTGASNVRELLPRSTEHRYDILVCAWLSYFHWLWKKARSCDIASFNGGLLTSLLSLWSFLSPFTLSMLSLFTFEAKWLNIMDR